MPQGPGRQAGLTVLESVVATGLVAAGSVFAWQYYQTEISSLLAAVTTVLERFVTS
jgi:type II secretory pathway component PulJ